MERRQDRLMALAIEAALHTCKTHSIGIAAEAMAEQGVPREVIVRVLVFQLQRRAFGARVAFRLENTSSWRLPAWLTRCLSGPG
jgi:hypothetical protein